MSWYSLIAHVWWPTLRLVATALVMGASARTTSPVYYLCWIHGKTMTPWKRRSCFQRLGVLRETCTKRTSCVWNIVRLSSNTFIYILIWKSFVLGLQAVWFCQKPNNFGQFAMNNSCWTSKLQNSLLHHLNMNLFIWCALWLLCIHTLCIHIVCIHMQLMNIFGAYFEMQ